MQRDGIAQLQPRALGVGLVHKALVRLFGQAALLHGDVVHALAKRLHAHHRLLAVRRLGHFIGDVAALRVCHALDRADRVKIVFGQPQRAEHADIHHVLLVIQRVGGKLHIRLRRAHARVKRHAQHHDEQDGQIAVQTAADLPQEILEQRPVFLSVVFHAAPPALTTRSSPRAWDVRSSAGARICRF